MSEVVAAAEKRELDADETSENQRKKKVDASSDQSNGNDTEKISKIKKQLEYYFGDSNFSRDKFLKKETEKTEDNLIPITVLLTFKKLKALSEDPNDVLTAARESAQLAVSEDNLRVGRADHAINVKHNSTPLSVVLKEFLDIAMSRTKNFQTSVIYEKFSDYDIVHVKVLSRPGSRSSILIEFSSESELERFISNSESFPIEDEPLQVMRAIDYFKQNPPIKHDSKELEFATGAFIRIIGFPEKGYFSLYVTKKIDPTQSSIQKYCFHTEKNEMYILCHDADKANNILEAFPDPFEIVNDGFSKINNTDGEVKEMESDTIKTEQNAHSMETEKPKVNEVKSHHSPMSIFVELKPVEKEDENDIFQYMKSICDGKKNQSSKGKGLKGKQKNKRRGGSSW